jgi:hypothetical protein
VQNSGAGLSFFESIESFFDILHQLIFGELTFNHNIPGIFLRNSFFSDKSFKVTAVWLHL